MTMSEMMNNDTMKKTKDTMDDAREYALLVPAPPMRTGALASTPRESLTRTLATARATHAAATALAIPRAARLTLSVLRPSGAAKRHSEGVPRGHFDMRGVDEGGEFEGLQQQGQARRRGIGPHSARVGALVALPDPLVVLGAAKPAVFAAVAQSKAADFFTHKKRLDHHPRTRRAEGTFKARTHGLLGLRLCFSDNHTLARRQPISLDHDRQVKSVEGRQRVFRCAVGFRGCGWYAVVEGQFLDEGIWVSLSNICFSSLNCCLLA